MRIRRVGIVGAGTMGAGIGALAASAGISVVLLDIPGKDGDPEDLELEPPRALDAPGGYSHREVLCCRSE